MRKVIKRQRTIVEWLQREVRSKMVRPLPPMLMVIFSRLQTPVKASLVNWLPGSL